MPSWVRLFDLVSTKDLIRNDPLKGLGQKIFDLCPAPARLLEVGCGSGVLSGYFTDFGYDVVATDKDPAVLAYAKKRLMQEMLGLPLFLERDAFNLRESMAEYAVFDLCWSAGLLEHFADEQIVELLRQQLAVANLVLFSVPGENYPRKEMGDERLLPLTKWFDLMESLNGMGVKVQSEPTISYYGKDQHILGVLKRKEPL